MAESHPNIVASVEQRVDAMQAALDARGLEPAQAVEELTHLAEEQWVPRNGARVVARAWTDPAFRQRLLADGRCRRGRAGARRCPSTTATSSCSRTRRRCRT